MWRMRLNLACWMLHQRLAIAHHMIELAVESEPTARAGTTEGVDVAIRARVPILTRPMRPADCQTVPSRDCADDWHSSYSFRRNVGMSLALDTEDPPRSCGLPRA